MQNMQQQWQMSYLFGANSDFIEELYEIYLEDPSRIDSKWRSYFDTLQEGVHKDVSHQQVRDKFSQLTSQPQLVAGTSELANSQTRVYALIAAFRAWGHKFAKLDPLLRQELVRPYELDYCNYQLANELEQEFWDDYDLAVAQKAKLKDIIAKLEAIYCASCGFEYNYISELAEQEWLRSTIEKEYLNFTLTKAEQLRLLEQLTAAEGLEKYLHNKYVGQKRFSLEGGDTFIPLLDRMLERSALAGVSDVYLGMAHRGRLNTLVNIAGKTPEKLFAEFDGNYPQADFVTSGDVKYHKGYACEYITAAGHKIKTTLAYNPSHLEVVNPLIQGMVRAKQDLLTSNKSAVLGVLIHGDSALIGLGTNQGVFTMSRTRTYGGCGLLHIVINNQVGFTTSRVSDNRSSRYCTDIAKMIEAPVIHVNADDIRAVAFVTDLAVNFRQKFERDIVIDLVCFRRHGHNEADDPTLTQPLMYNKVKQHPGTRTLYARMLISEGIIQEGDEVKLFEDYRQGLVKGVHINQAKMLPLPRYSFPIKDFLKARWDDKVASKISKSKLHKLAQIITDKPQDPEFKLHPTILRLIDNRIAMGEGKQPCDFGMAETLAYAAILDEGVGVRLSGEDAGRGTFSHRHAAWHNMNRQQLSVGIYLPLKNAENNSLLAIYDSILNEEAVLGFEYGYSLENINNLTIWEGQFGDFANGAQVIIDQFIVSGEAKWGNLSRLVLMLPHGFDGQGPEHSSARIERFLQLAAENNLVTVTPTTAAQIFHMLRRQAKTKYVKPLIVFLSKRLLRFKGAMSQVDDLCNGEFLPVIGDTDAGKKAHRVILCSGQVYYDLVQARSTAQQTDKVAIIRIEQLYPFPQELLVKELARYTNAKEFLWVQEEPYNQGPWLQIRDDLEACLSASKRIIPLTRPRAAAPACGSPHLHQEQLSTLLSAAFGKL